MRYAAAIAVSAAIAAAGYRRRSLEVSGAVVGCLVGTILTAANVCFFAALFTFFVVGSIATKFRAKLKSRLEADYKEGGQRNWVQVLCNGGPAAVFAFIYIGEVGCGEHAIDWQHHYLASWSSMLVFGCLAACCGDTLASEIGSVVGYSKPRLITNFQKVPTGTNGGMSMVGTLSSGLGGALVGLAYYVALLLAVPPLYVSRAPYQGLIIAHGALCGLFGSALDSFLGATLQYSGLNRHTGQVVSCPGPGVEHICGRAILDNHGVNLVSSALAGLCSPFIAFHLWKLFI